MCLIAFAIDSHPDWPFILVANRDEFYKRPTAPLSFWPDAPVLGGRDLEAGGSWLGLARNGRFAAVTNYREGSARDTSSVSRGTLVRDFLLGQDDARNHSPNPAVTSGYNLIWGDRSGFYHTSNRGTERRRLDRGIYTLSNALLDTPWPKALQARSRLIETLQQRTLEPEQLFQLLADRTPAPDSALPDTGVPLEWERLLSSCFIHSPDYGTRSMSIILQHCSGELRVMERRFGFHGRMGSTDFRLQQPGIIPR